MIEEKAEEYLLSKRQLCDTFKPPLTIEGGSQVSRCRRKSLNKDLEWNLIKS